MEAEPHGPNILSGSHLSVWACWGMGDSQIPTVEHIQTRARGFPACTCLPNKKRQGEKAQGRSGRAERRARTWAAPRPAGPQGPWDSQQQPAAQSSGLGHHWAAFSQPRGHEYAPLSWSLVFHSTCAYSTFCFVFNSPLEQKSACTQATWREVKNIHK